MRTLLLAVLPCLLLPLLLVPAPARACTPPFSECREAHVRPGWGESVAASMPALVFVPTFTQMEGVDGGQSPSLHRVDGGEVPLVATGDGVVELVPSVPLEEHAAYVLRYEEPCTAGQLDAGTRVVEHPFRTLAHTPLPQTAGRLEVLAEEELELPAGGAVDSCGNVAVEDPSKPPVRAAHVRLGFFPSTELVPLLPVATLSLQVGTLGMSSRFATPTERQQHPGLLRVYHATTPCVPGTVMAGPPASLWLGEHQARLSVHLPGAAEQPPALTVPFTLACDAAPVTPPPGDDEAPRGGCSAASAGLLLPLVLVPWALRRRRRGRHDTSCTPGV